jgi:hypothetical protein
MPGHDRLMHTVGGGPVLRQDSLPFLFGHLD